MKVKLVYLLLAAITLVSCERKLRAPDMNGSGSSGLIGRWKLVSTGGTTIASSEIDLLGDKLLAENTLIYSSSNAIGFYDITSTEFKGNGIGYDFSGRVILKVYENSVLINETPTLIPTTTIPASNPTSKYRLIGTDSIYFEGSTGSVQFQAGGTATVPSGCRYKIEGNRMTMRMKYSTSYTSTSGGITSLDKQWADVEVILERQ